MKHAQPIAYKRYTLWAIVLLVLPLLWMPWTPLVLNLGMRWKQLWHTPILRFALLWAGFVVVFVAVLVATVLVSWVVKKLISAVGLGPLDRLLGSLFGLMRGVVILLAVTVLVGMTPMRETEAWKQAQGSQWLQQFLHVLKPVLPAPSQMLPEPLAAPGTLISGA